MLGINWKYLIIIVVIAGLIYFLVSIFTLGTVEAIEGNWAGYLILILTWMGLIILSQYFQERLKVPDLANLVLFGMILHVYICLYYFLSTISEWLAFSTIVIPLFLAYAWHNREQLLNKFKIFAFFTPNPGHPFAYDKEYNAYVYKEEDERLKAILLINFILWLFTTFLFLIYELTEDPGFPWSAITCAIISGISLLIYIFLKYFCIFRALKYLEIKGGYDPVELLAVFYKADIELTLEIHYIKDKLHFYCGIMERDRLYDRALELCKKKFYELFDYLRTFGYEPSAIWDDYTMEKILEGPYLIWDPLEIPKIHKNPSPEGEAAILESGMNKKKTSIFQLNMNIFSRQQNSQARFSIQRSGNRNIRTQILETNKSESGLFTFLNRIANKSDSVDDFVFVLRLHPFTDPELHKEQKRIKSNLTRLINNFKSDIVRDEAKFKLMQLNSWYGDPNTNVRKSKIMHLLYPDESKEFERFWQELDNYQLGEEIGYWKACTYFVGKKYLINMLSTDCKSQILPLDVNNFPEIIKRKISGNVESLDSHGLVNYLPFEPILQIEAGNDVSNTDEKKVREKDLF
ncbi:MAG: hypothetical protein ACFFDN_39080 [Candidatus Hodarchaeota archaeon]